MTNVAGDPAADEPSPLVDQVAVVTGGGRGVGRAIACLLGGRGAHVAVAARTASEVEETVDLIERAGGTAIAFALDVADREAVIAMVVETERRLGPVDLLVNDAAVVAPFGPAWEVEPERWWRLLEVNLYGSFLCAHAVLGGMIQRRRGRIVNLASAVGLNPVPYGSAYVTSKAAVIRLTEALAIEAETYGVTVFAIDPGWVSTSMTEYVTASESGQRWMPWAASVIGTDAHVPPERAAELVATLASGRADRLTGRYLRVSDDLEDLIGRAEYVRDHDLHSMRLRDLPPEQC
jgi:NAD(P)-dependent dehydrogenase (short-subunit alcohol dehydrogenase family)